MDVELYVRSGSMTTAAGIARLTGRNCYKRRMNTYKRHRFSPDIISYAVWLYFGSNLSHRGYGDTYNIDEVYVKINGKQQYLWRAVSQEDLPHERSGCFGYGETVEVYLRVKYDGAAAKHFFKR